MSLGSNPLDGLSVLVTGAAGYLGGVILSALRNVGAHAVGTARFNSKQLSDPVIYGDLEDSHSLRALDSHGPYHVVVHCAASLPSTSNDTDLVIRNIRMTSNVAEWSRGAGVQQFCFLSGCNVYGAITQPATELTLPAPIDLYGVSKLACEHIVHVLFPESCMLRIAAPYGPNLRTETVVKRFLYLASKRQPLSLLGTGAREQHFIYEEDVAAAVVLAIANRATGTFNISGPSPISMMDLAQNVLTIFKQSLENSIQHSGEDPQEHYRGNFPHEAAKKSFGFQPQVSLEEGLSLCARAWGLL